MAANKHEREYDTIANAAKLVNRTIDDLLHFGAKGILPIYALLPRLPLKKYDTQEFPQDEEPFHNFIITSGPVRMITQDIATLEAGDVPECNVFWKVDAASKQECRYEVHKSESTWDAQGKVAVCRENLRIYRADSDAYRKPKPLFVTRARPLRVDSLLLKMADNDTVKYQDNIGGGSSTGWCSAGEYRAEIEARIKRQAEGFFTLDEAAQVLADSQSGVEVTGMISQMRSAFANKKLQIRNHGDHLPILKEKDIRDFHSLVSVSDIDAWLDGMGAGYRFPPPPNSLTPHTEKSQLLEFVLNDKHIDWHYWIHQMPVLTAAQAARLMNALDPDIFENLDSHPNANNPRDAVEKARRMQRLAESQSKQSAKPKDWQDWAIEHEFDVHFGFCLAVDELAQAAPADPKAQGEAEVKINAPLQRQQFQETEILRVISELGYTANALPKIVLNKPGVKAEVRNKLNFSVNVFNKAWERLRARREIADA